jgi:hypothetical protein
MVTTEKEQGGSEPTVQVLIERLDTVRQREQTVYTAAGAFRSLLLLMGLVVSFFIIDWVIVNRVIEDDASSKLVRALIVIGMLVYLGWALWNWVWLEFARERDDDEMALRVEQANPDLRGRLISTIQLTRSLGKGEHVGSVELIKALETHTIDFAQALDFSRIINFDLLKKAAVAAVAITMASVLLGVWQPDFAGVLIDRIFLGETEYPTNTRIKAVTPDARVPRGDDHVVTVELDPNGTLPKQVTLVVRDPATGSESRYVLSPQEGVEYIYGGTERGGKIERIVNDLDYRAFAGDARGEWHHIEMLERPAVGSLELKYFYPKYTRLPSLSRNTGEIRTLQGTRVEIHAKLNKRVTKATLEFTARGGAREIKSMERRPGEGKAFVSLMIATDGFYSIVLEDSDDLKNREPAIYPVRLQADRPPSVSVTFPASEKLVTQRARWPIRFEVQDDFGVQRGWLKFQERDAYSDFGDPEADPDDAPAILSIPIEKLLTNPRQKFKVNNFWFDLEPYGFEIDRRLTYWIEVEDNRHVYENGEYKREPNIIKSRTYDFVIADEARVREELDLERNAAIQGIEVIRNREIDSRDGVEIIRDEVTGEIIDPDKEEEKKDEKKE